MKLNAWLRSRGRLLLAALSVSAGCVVGRPWRAPDVAPPPGDGPVLVSVTYAVLDERRRGDFDDYITTVSDAMAAGEFEGLVGYAIRKELFGDEVWTASAWVDEAALRRFVTSATHQQAIERAGRAIARMETRRLSLPRSELPIAWERVEEILASPAAAR
jgi:heme-degrading monooxygenase HmoA